MDYGAEPQKQVFLKCRHLRPIGNVGSEAQLVIRPCLFITVVNPFFVNTAVIFIIEYGHVIFNVRCCGQHSLVSRSGGNGTGIHQGDKSRLSIPGLGTLPVGEVPGGVADGKTVIGGGISRAEAGAAESGLYDGSSLHEPGGGSVSGDGKGNGGGGRVDRQVKIAVSYGVPLQYGRSLDNVLVHAAGAAHNYPLVCNYLSILYAIHKIWLYFIPHDFAALLLHFGQDALRVLLKFMNSHCLGGVEGQGHHAFHLVQFHINYGVIAGAVGYFKFSVVLFPAHHLIKTAHFVVRLPNGGQTACLRGHYVYAGSIVHGKGRRTRTCEFQNLVFNLAAGEGLGYKGNGHIVGAHAPPGFAG